MVKGPELAIVGSLDCFPARKGKRKKECSRSQVGLRAVGVKPCDQSCHGGSQSLAETERQTEGFQLLLVDVTKYLISSG